MYATLREVATCIGMKNSGPSSDKFAATGGAHKNKSKRFKEGKYCERIFSQCGRVTLREPCEIAVLSWEPVAELW